TQNQQYETRTGSPLKGSSLMSPVEMGQLEFADLYPYILSTDQQSDFSSPPGLHNTHWQNMTFTRTDTMSNGNNGTFHPAMTIEHARNGQGQYEPKVANGFGYYVTVAPSPPSNDPTNPHMAGFWHWLEIGVVDVEDPNITAKHPFYIRLGINYKSTTQNGATIQPPPPGTSYFTIQRGYKTYGNGSLAVNSPFDSGKTNNISKYWTDWSSTKTKCYTMDDLNYDNVPWKKNNLVAACPAYDTEHPLLRLKAVSSIDKLQTKNGDGTYTPVLDAYYYDPATGYLWLNIVQQNPNPAGPSPLGSCDPDVVGANIDPSCPDTAHGESYYACPTAGCIVYTIEVKNSSAYTYVPGPSTGQPKAADLVAPPPTAAQNKLVLYGTNTVVAPVLAMDKAGLPYYTASQNTAPACPVPQPPPS
ncbi:MAG: hypothetical protein ACRESG_01075, partial [Gammaproteobacteria bacterium]